jgi:lactate dehydrogenase-like 2-hydroxyacid dehydrogenase
MLDMTEPILVVTTRYTKEVEDRINRDYSVRRSPNQFPFSQQELLSATEGADALFITPADRLDFAFFQKVSPTVKIIATFSVGFEHIDVEAAARRKIPVAYTPVSTVKQRQTSLCCFCWALRVALMRLRSWFERESGSP